MKLTLAENIRAFRKERKMTQEQLATVLDVTVGAVYKWESGLSIPELDMIVQMADFFDTSVDVLLGYRMRNNSIDAALERMQQQLLVMDPAALTEAEKLLAKYPHAFRVVYACAEAYLALGTGGHDVKMLRRALALEEQALALLPQNEDKQISETSIMHSMSITCFELGEKEKALEILMQHNQDGCFSHEIGAMLAVFMNRPEEAVPYLSAALGNSLSFLINASMGYVFVYRSRNDWDTAIELISFCSDFMTRLKKDGRHGMMDKVHAEVQLALAYVLFKAGRDGDCREALRTADRLSSQFDSEPEYSFRSIRFVEHAEQSAAFDALGATAAESIRYLLGLLNDPAFTALWKEMSSCE